MSTSQFDRMGHTELSSALDHALRLLAEAQWSGFPLQCPWCRAYLIDCTGHEPACELQGIFHALGRALPAKKL